MIHTLITISLSLLLIAATYPNMDDYWQSPSATASNHDWSELEKNMRPEACAQCHEAQFDAWKHSRHSKAFSPGLIGQFPNMGHMQGNDCLRCHAPLSEQLFDGDKDMMSSLKTLRKHPTGVNQQADLDSAQAKLPLRHAGVTCAVCHVRNGNRFGPPRKGSNTLGHINTETHGGFTVLKQFEQSGFCAECHQFPQDYAINGKPLENTVFEWQQSRFAKQGNAEKQCQGCHMPDRKHAFKGIHDKAFTLSGLDIQASLHHGLPQLKITSKNIGHAFPTYVTPKIWVTAQALNKQGKTIKTWHWNIVREVFFDDGWEEKQDSRIMPGESRLFAVKQVPEHAVSVAYRVRVIPDNFYKGVYQSLLDSTLQDDARALIQRALDEANQNDYTLFSTSIALE